MSGYIRDAGDDARPGKRPPFLIHPVRRPEPALEESLGVVDQRRDALAHKKPPELVLPLLPRRAAALAQPRFLLRDFLAAVEEGGGG